MKFIINHLILIIILLIIQATNCNSSEVNKTINLSQIINLKYNYEVFEKDINGKIIYPEWVFSNTIVGSGESWGECLLNAVIEFSRSHPIVITDFDSSIHVKQIKIDNVDINCFTFRKSSINNKENNLVFCCKIKYTNSSNESKVIIHNSMSLGSGDNQKLFNYNFNNGCSINDLLLILSSAGMLIDHQGIDPRTGECFMSISFGNISKITNLSTEKIHDNFFNRQFLISEFGEAAGIINQEDLTYLYNLYLKKTREELEKEIEREFGTNK